MASLLPEGLRGKSVAGGVRGKPGPSRSAGSTIGHASITIGHAGSTIGHASITAGHAGITAGHAPWQQATDPH